MGHGARHPIASRFGLASGDTNLDKFTRALTVTDNILRQLYHQHRQCLRKVLGLFGTCCDLDATLSRGREGDGIVSRRVTVYRDAIEARLHRHREHCIKKRDFNGGVGRYEGQHGRHVGTDHTCALGHTRKCAALAVQVNLSATELGAGIGCEDGAGSTLPTFVMQIMKRRR